MGLQHYVHWCTPCELFCQRQIKYKIPIYLNIDQQVIDQETRKRDKIQKGKGKEYESGKEFV